MIFMTEAQTYLLSTTGYSLPLSEREHHDRVHRLWAAATGLFCLGILIATMTYPMWHR